MIMQLATNKCTVCAMEAQFGIQPQNIYTSSQLQLLSIEKACRPLTDGSFSAMCAHRNAIKS